MRGLILSAIPIAAVALGGSSLAAWADSAAAKACRDQAANTYAIMDCQKAELRDVEAVLKTAYEKAMAALPANQKAKLLEAERRWVAFREADCGVYYGQQTGTIAGIEGGDCMVQHARDRIRDLATFSEP